jgi:hypothetical protein
MAQTEPKRMTMRAVLVPVLALFCLFGGLTAAPAGSYQSDGTYTGTPSPAVTALFAANPNGGDALMAAIRDLLISNPGLADDVAFVASRANAAQRFAAAAGMAQAYTALINRGDSNGAGRIVTAAQLSGSPVLQAAVTRAVGSTIGANTYQFGGTTQTGCSRSGTVSPSQAACQ